MSYRVMHGTEATAAGYANALFSVSYNQTLNGSSTSGGNNFAWTNAPALNKTDPVATPGTGDSVVLAVSNTVGASAFWANTFSQNQSSIDHWSASGEFHYDAGPPDLIYPIVQIDEITWQVPVKISEFGNGVTNHNGVPDTFSGLISSDNGGNWQPVGGQPLAFPLIGSQIGPVTTVYMYVRFVPDIYGPPADLYPISLPCRRFYRCFPWEG